MATPNNQFRLKLAPSTTYDISIDWGDGTREFFKQTTSSNESLAGLTHTYLSAGIYRVSITENASGGFPRIYFNGTSFSSVSSDDVKVIDIIQWGNPTWTLKSDAFEGCSNLSAVATDNTDSNLKLVSNFNNIWHDCVSLKEILPIDTRTGTTFISSWSNCTSLKYFSKLNMENATDIKYAWRNCQSLTAFPDIDLPSLQSKSGDGQYIWENCISLSAFPNIEGLSALTDFDRTWRNCTKMKSFSTTDFTSANRMYYTWYNCTSLSSLPAINTQNVSSFEGSWYNCTSLSSFPLIDVSKSINFVDSWRNSGLRSFPEIDPKEGLDFTRSWYQCYNLRNFTYLDVSKAKNFTQSWYQNFALSSFSLTSFPVGEIFYETWAGSNSNAFTRFPTLSVPNAKTFEGAWWSCAGLRSFPYFEVPKVTDFSRSWRACTTLSSFELTDFPSATAFNLAWYDCYAFRNFPTINVLSAINFDRSWMNCIQLRNFPYLNIPKATIFSQSWTNCNNLSSFALTSFPMGQEFYEAWYNTGFTDFPKIDVLSGINFTGAWGNNSKLRNFPYFEVPKATTFQRSWQNCISLSSFSLTSFPVGNNFTQAWDNCDGFKDFPLISVPANNANFTNAWSNCLNLSSFPPIDFSGTNVNLTRAWLNSPSLSSTSFSNLSTKNVANFEGAFAFPRTSTQGKWALSASPLKTIPNFLLDPSNTNSSLNFANSWRGCGNLLSFPDNVNMRNATNIAGAWGDCISLTQFPNIMLSAVQTFGRMNGTYNVGDNLDDSAYGDNLTLPSLDGAWMNTELTTFPLLCTQNGTDFSGAWYGMKNLSSFPNLNVGKGTKFDYSWRRCYSLSSFPLLIFSSSTNLNGTFSHMRNLTNMPKISSHPTSSTVFGGTWCGCSKLVDFPEIDTTRVTSFFDTYTKEGAWQDCIKLSSFPPIKTQNVTDFRRAWAGCLGLSASPFPIINMSKMTNGMGCFAGVKLDTNTYSALLTTLCATNTNLNVFFNAGNSTFNLAASAARNFLTRSTTASPSGRGWNITDGGYSELSSGPINLVGGLYATKHFGPAGYYFAEGSDWPDYFATVGPQIVSVSAGVTKIDNYALSDTGDYFNWEFKGYFKPMVSGNYTFALKSDDVSAIWIRESAFYPTLNNALAYTGQNNNDTGVINLIQNVYYPIRIQYGDVTGTNSLTLQLSSATIPTTTDLSPYVFYNNQTNGY